VINFLAEYIVSVLSPIHCAHSSLSDGFLWADVCFEAESHALAGRLPYFFQTLQDS
jgi:hypothetical protein